MLLNASQELFIIHKHSFLIGNYTAICPCCYSKAEDKVVIQKVVDWQAFDGDQYQHIRGQVQNKSSETARDLLVKLLMQTLFFHHITRDSYQYQVNSLFLRHRALQQSCTNKIVATPVVKTFTQMTEIQELPEKNLQH